MRYLGLDLGTKTLGVAISDKTNTVISILDVIHFASEDYESAANQLLTLIAPYEIAKIALGFPKNMNNTKGFASARSLSFKELLESKTTIPIVLVDERLSTMEAKKYLLAADVSRKKQKKVIDGLAATLILETLIKMEQS